MIDLDALHAHAERFCNSGNDRQCCITAREGVELIERLLQAEKDSARYRWLRDSACTDDLGEFDNALRQHRDSLMDDLMNA